MSRGHYQAVVLPVKRARAEVYQANFRIFNNIDTVLYVKGRVAEENVFWF